VGTNYYLKTRSPCQHCGSPLLSTGQGLHVGKSSGGWRFSLRIYPKDELALDFIIREFVDWLPLFRAHGVVDEYGRDVTVDEMVACITRSEHPAKEDLRAHDIGPSRLCVGRGAEGAYDLMVGWFS
jgi:hypothetical protein